MKLVKTLGLTLVVLLVISMVAVPTTAFARADKRRALMENEHHSGIYAAGNATAPHVRVFNNVTFEQALDLAYTVRNITMPLLNWSSEHNVTLANVILRLGDRLLEKAINESSVNETRAKVFAMVAAIIYGHAPVTAYPVLAKTIRDNLGENNTITNDTVLAVYNKALELRNVLEQAETIAIEYNVSVPSQVNALKIIAEGLLNTSERLLDEGYTVLAFKYVVRAYHVYVIAYGMLVKNAFIVKLNLNIRPDEPLTHRLIVRKIKKEIVERILMRLPRWVRVRVIEKIKSGEVKTWSDLRRVIREEVEKYREMLMNKSIDVTANVMVMIVVYLARNPGVNITVQDAINQWLADHGFIKGFGRFGMIDFGALKQYFKELAYNVSKTYNVTGLELVYKVIQEFEKILSDEIGVDIDLIQVFEQIIASHHMEQETTHHHH